VANLLKAGADPRVVDADGNTPLHLAATTNRPEITLAFLDAGANPDACNHAGHCPLALSVGRTVGSGVGAAVVLLERGAATIQAMLDNLLKNTIRRAATMPNSGQLVDLLLQRNASPAVLTNWDFLFLLARDIQMQKLDGIIGLTQEARGVLHLLAKHRPLPARLIGEIL
jgi:ankyrin repeat protein